jgi:hypothetical protein
MRGNNFFEFLKKFYGIVRVELGDDAKGVESNKQCCLGDN